MNSFVNPYQRGVELPPGCKDLIDVLAKAGVDRLETPFKAEVGPLRRVRSCIGCLTSHEFAGQVLVIMYFEKRVLFIVGKNEDAFKLRFLLRKSDSFVEEAITEIFGEATLTRDIGMGMEEFKTVNIQLPEFWDAAAQMVIDLLIRGYGVTENDRLIFSYQQKALWSALDAG